MQERKLFSSGAKWEDIVGYSRAVRVGNVIEISGTTAVDGETVIGENDIYEQTIFILNKIEKTLKEAGSRMEDVVRTRMFVTDISKWEEVAKAHGKFFKEIKPVTTMVQVSQLIDKKLLIEIEATARIAEK
ncbi:MAG: RidA family protein [Ginsengibacter sp.]|jgi:enamine deaminase RidA (YjgF/YER057c/UK114 family)